MKRTFHHRQNKQKIFLVLLMTAMLVPGFCTFAQATDDFTPPFTAGAGTPNVMFIFDNSDSMHDSPYKELDDAGMPQAKRPNMEWRKGYTIDGTGYITGTDNEKYAGEGSMSEVSIPAKVPAELPPGGYTRPINHVAEHKQWGRIFDDPDGPQIGEIVVDNLDSAHYSEKNSSKWEESGGWPEYNSSSRWTDDNNEYAEFTPEIPTAGDYEVFVFACPYSSRDTNAKYEVEHAGGTYEVRVDQRSESDGGTGGQWYSIGTFTFDAGTSGLVRITRDSQSTGTSTSADAVKFVPSTTAAPMDWDAIDSVFNDEYKYTVIKVSSPYGDPDQYGTICTRSSWNGYWRLCDSTGTIGEDLTSPESDDPDFIMDFSSGVDGSDECLDPTTSTDCTTYNISTPFTYEIVTREPGTCTRVKADELNRVYDAYVDWDAVDSVFNDQFRYGILEIYEGTNAGIQRTITNRSSWNKYWTLDEDLPESCDLTSKYRILRSDPNRKAYGGNHPASKMYQAKKALNTVLNADDLCETKVDGVCTKYKINMGFATFFTKRYPSVTARYYRLKPGEAGTDPIYHPEEEYIRVRANYYKVGTEDETYQGPTEDSFYSASNRYISLSSSGPFYNSHLFSGVAVGDYIYRNYHEGDCDAQIIKYELMSVTPKFSDTGVTYEFYFKSDPSWGSGWGYTTYTTQTQYHDLTTCTGHPAMPGTWSGGWTRVPSSDSCYQAETCEYIYHEAWTEPGEGGTDPCYQLSYADTVGDYTVSDSSAPRYVDTATGMVNPYPGYEGGSSPNERDPVASPVLADGDWIYVDSEVSITDYGLCEGETASLPDSAIILDNQDSSVFETKDGDAWSESGANPEWAGSSVYSNTEGDWAQWNFTVPSDGDYDVYVFAAYWDTRDTNALYTVTHSGGTYEVRLNQQEIASEFHLVGTFTFSAEDTYYVRVTRDGGDPADGSTSADAVLIQPTGDDITYVIEPQQWDSSFFYYAPEGTTNKPHGWSYKRTSASGDHEFGVQTFADSAQKDPYYPAVIGDEKGNTDGDDQIIFVNLPVYDGDDENHGDDVTGVNVQKILSYIGVQRAHSPNPTNSRIGHLSLWDFQGGTDYDWDGIDRDNSSMPSFMRYETQVRQSNYDYTMMPYTNSLPVNELASIFGRETPLAASLQDAKTYYESYFRQDYLTQIVCRNNYVILLTDGLETCARDASGFPDTQAPVDAAASLLAAKAVMDDGTEVDAPVRTYVIGFGLSDAEKTLLNNIAVAGGTGHAYFATNVDELVEVLLDDIISDITAAGNFSRTSPRMNRFKQSYTDETGEFKNVKIYSAYYGHPGWQGHLEAYWINPDGSIGDPVADWSGDCDGDGTVDADAGCVLTSAGADARTIYTWIGSNSDSTKAFTEFVDTNAATLAGYLNPSNVDINEDGSTDDTDAEVVIGFIRDPGYANGIYAGTRKHTWLLSDIINSSPIVVEAPQFISKQPGYEAFQATSVKDRDSVIYIGSNGGMLHCFNESTGVEKWAYVPKAVLGKLHEIRLGHRFTVDGTPRIAELDLSANLDGGTDGDGWKTVLVGALGEGGKAYFALDVTDPDNPVPMWEFTDTDNSAGGTTVGAGGVLANTWSAAAFGRIAVSTGDSNITKMSAVFVGGGYSDPSNTNEGNRVYILKASDGTLLKEFAVGASNNNIPARILAPPYAEKGASPVHHRTREVYEGENATLLRGNTEALYFGDVNGTIWVIKDMNSVKEETGSDYTAWNPTLEKLYEPATPKPIFHKLAFADLVDCGTRLIFAGTGDETSHNEKTGVQNFFYEIADRDWREEDGLDDEGFPLETTLVDHLQATGQYRLNWMKTLDEGEKILSEPVRYLSYIYFTSYLPPDPSDSSEECVIEYGTGYTYGLNISSCYSPSSTGGEPGGIDMLTEDEINSDPDLSDEEKQKMISDMNKGRIAEENVGPPSAPAVGSQIIVQYGDKLVSYKGPSMPGRIIYWFELD